MSIFKEITPVSLLKDQLEVYEKNIRKSTEAFSVGLITEETHQMHIRNNTPKIKEFNQAITILTSMGL